MARSLTAVLWVMLGFVIVAIASVVGYVILKNEPHTGLDPYWLIGGFLSAAIVAGALSIIRNRFNLGLSLPLITLIAGVIGALLIVYLDRTNRLVQYDRWIERGMP